MANYTLLYKFDNNPVTITQELTKNDYKSPLEFYFKKKGDKKIDRITDIPEEYWTMANISLDEVLTEELIIS